MNPPPIRRWSQSGVDAARRVAESVAELTVRVEADGVDRRAVLIPGPDTRMANVADDQCRPTPLAAGRQVMKLVFLDAGTSGGVGHYNWLQLQTTNLGCIPVRYGLFYYHPDLQPR
jgi:hypothetical protein